MGLAVSTFRIPYFGRYWTTNVLQFMAFQTQQVAAQWVVTGLTGSRAALGMVGFIQGFSGFVIAPMAGVASDRFPKKNLLMLTRAVLLGILALMGVLVFTDVVRVWHILLLSVLLGLVQAIQQPTAQTYVYDIVGRDRIQGAVALNSAGQGLSQMAGPALAGVIISVVGAAGAYASSSLAVVFAIIFLATIPIAGLASGAKRVSAFADMKEGVVYIMRDPALRWVLLACCASFFCGALQAMRPVFARHVLGLGSVKFGMLAGSQGIGTIVGALAVALLLPSIRRPGLTIVLGALSYATCMFLYSFAFSFEYLLVLEFQAGISSQVWTISAFAGLQAAVPAHLRGRIVSAVVMVFQGASMGQLAIGMLADGIGDKKALMIWGLIPMVYLSLELLFARKALLSLRPQTT